MREWLLRAPREAGLHDVALIDARDAAVRTVKVGFSALGLGDDETREDVLRIEDGERVLEERCVGSECRQEDVAAGVVAVLSNEGKAVAEGAAPADAVAGRREGVIDMRG